MSAGEDRTPDAGGASPVVRGVVAGLIVLAAVAVAVALFMTDGGYRVTADFTNAGQLVKGSEVRVAGVSVGTVENIEVSPSGTARVTFTVDRDYAPLRRGTRAIVKPTSLSGIANRYVDLQLAPDDAEDIDDGGRLGGGDPAAAAEPDPVFPLFHEET